MPSVTVQVQGLLNTGPICELMIAPSVAAEEAIKQGGGVVPSPTKVTAMIDTGASRSVIQLDIPATLGLRPIGAVKINTPSSNMDQFTLCF